MIIESIYQHERLVSIFEERYILKLYQPIWNIVLVNEETSEQHEWNNQDRCQCHCKLFIRECNREDQRITSSSAINENQDDHYIIMIIDINLQCKGNV